ncbi:hypothetical protein AHAS_Ahas01G0010400 [Arachis hypogaea]
MPCVIVKTDLEISFNSISNSRLFCKCHNALIRNIERMKLKPWQVEFKHIYREANSCVDWLAKQNLDCEQGF